MGMQDDALLYSEAKTTLDTMFEKGMQRDVPLWTSELFEEIPSKGKGTKYPFVGGMSGLRRWKGERIYDSYRRYAYWLENEKFEKSISIDCDDIEDEQLGGYQGVMNELARQAKLWPQDLVIEAIKLGESKLCYDGQNYFDTDHPIEPGNAASGTFPNLFTGRPLLDANGDPIWANFEFVWNSMEIVPGVDGRPRGFGQSGKVALVVPSQMYIGARKLAISETLPGGGVNPYRGLVEVHKGTDLGIGGGANATSWYLFELGAGLKPFVFQMRKDPKSNIVAIDKPTDQHVFEHDEVLYGTKARGASGYTLPELGAKAKA